MVCLGNKQIILSFLRLHPSTAFWTLVDYEGFFVSSKGFLPTLADIMVIWINLPISTHFSSLICHLLLDHVQFSLIHGPSVPGSYAVLFLKASDFIFITRHIHHWAWLLLRPTRFFLSGALSNFPPLFPSIILDPCDMSGLSSGAITFCLFILFMGFSWQESWSGLPFPPQVDHILSELFTMTSTSWIALHGMAHSFSELCRSFCHHKAVIHRGIFFFFNNRLKKKFHERRKVI